MAGRLLMSPQQIEADPQAWKHVRRGGLTASEIAAVMGFSPKTHESAFSVYVAKTTGNEPERDNDAMLRGRVLEPYVAEAFEERYPYLELHPGGLYASDDRPWQLATLDRQAVDLSEWDLKRGTDAALRLMNYAMPVEIKTSIPGDGFGEPGTAQLPAHIKLQVMWQMDVRSAHTAWVPVQFMQPWKLVVYIVEWDDEVDHDISIMRAEGAEFMERIRTECPPPVDWRPATTRALKALHPTVEDRAVSIPVKLARRYKAARLAAAAADERLTQAQNEMRQRMGSAKYAVTTDHGRTVKVVTRSKHPRKTLPSDVLREKFPKVAEEIEVETIVDALYPGGWAQ